MFHKDFIYNYSLRFITPADGGLKYCLIKVGFIKNMFGIIKCIIWNKFIITPYGLLHHLRV